VSFAVLTTDPGETINNRGDFGRKSRRFWSSGVVDNSDRFERILVTVNFLSAFFSPPKIPESAVLGSLRLSCLIAC
jgi:hypothetical protein